MITLSFMAPMDRAQVTFSELNRCSVPINRRVWVLSNLAQFDEDVVRETCIAVIRAVLVSAFDIVIFGWTRATEAASLGFAQALKAIWF